jgi:RNA polymerase sigma factor (sigma-70 family)
MSRRRPSAADPAAPNILDDIAVALVRRASGDLCRRCGFPWSDRDDIEQDLFLALHRAVPKFDPRRSSWRAFAAAVIDHRAASLARDRGAARRVPPALRLLGDPAQDQRRVGPPVDPAETVPLALDLERALTRLPPALRALADRLSDKPLTRAATSLGISRSAARLRRADIRRRFEDQGLWEDG